MWWPRSGFVTGLNEFVSCERKNKKELIGSAHFGFRTLAHAGNAAARIGLCNALLRYLARSRFLLGRLLFVKVPYDPGNISSRLIIRRHASELFHALRPCVICSQRPHHVK